MFKYYFLFLAAALLINTAKSQTYKIDTLQYQGPQAKVVNLVIMGDGYTAAELGYFQEDAQYFVDYFFKTEPFRQYQRFFNVFAINTISKESGAKHACTAADCPKVEHNHKNLPARFNKFPKRIVVPEASPNTIFGSSFDNNNIHRLVVPQNGKLIEEILSNHLPDYTQVVILVNSPYYGGSGGKYATATVNYDSNDIAVHEIGHSFANLGDEYWAGVGYAVERSNRTQEADPKKVAWSHWIGVNDVGVYTYGGKDARSNWFRPHEYCKMQYLTAPFCSVCQEVFVETIHRKSNPIIGETPVTTSTWIGKTVNKFTLKLLKPSPNTLSVRWYLNTKLLTTNVDSIYLNTGLLSPGVNILKAEVLDTTDLVRKPGYENHIYTKEWKIKMDEVLDLKMPVLTWGDTLETCYDGYQALSVKNPQAGLVYKWYDKEKAITPIAVGNNWVTPRLKQSRTYYLSASFEDKVTPRKAIYVNVLPRIAKPTSIVVKLSAGRYKISIDKTLANNYKLIWYTEGDKQLRGGNAQTAIEIDAKDAPAKIYLQLIDKTTTCKSEKFEIKLK